MRKLVGKINSISVTLVLSLFYFVGVGAAYLLWRFGRIFKKENRSTYWQKSKNYKKADFLSAY
ncbi:hypothetical protein A2V61_02100 [Candidatus Woesebacteria bacterium RBG_19FT_COMBO_47_8]|uniref:Uncharacterized protein n=1 Tax=Candidatus Woesebacteria bacterium RBG_13_46_13 TaxID=1802479 RepID=A0A1F7X6A5_9BACT|nr:MAG: hypothetical protein A2Y68_00575 [Candidatus Woesebacteria bacterium RBG_13_46_13]OGM18214.1 MAG: hypothetical protein A2V61_02100 [Candidatus Woesebacteria bacterium RBG_19FT_COMBO_47_8]HJX59409.1 hypothetical protein [Patescibacteria group bacterium]